MGYASAAILAICVFLLISGHYRRLNQAIRWIMVLLFVSSMASFVLVLWNGPVGTPFDVPTFTIEASTLAFLLALMGWMPIPLDAAAWHSVWALEHKDMMQKEGEAYQSPDRFELKDAMWDFN
ncbi:hypothetical protein RZS08_41895, partial [Arthrospira platensis SPKY1]|nr:hypothetical protein [Arthrospira platensis SPKY1]